MAASVSAFGGCAGHHRRQLRSRIEEASEEGSSLRADSERRAHAPRSHLFSCAEDDTDLYLVT